MRGAAKALKFIRGVKSSNWYVGRDGDISRSKKAPPIFGELAVRVARVV
jgi:hypothetical protein